MAKETMTFDEIQGTSQATPPAKRTMTWQEITGEAPKPAEPRGVYKALQISDRATRELVNVADMVLSTPAFLVGAAGDVGKRLAGAWGGLVEELQGNPWVTEKSKPYLPSRAGERRKANAQAGVGFYEKAMEVGGSPLARLSAAVAPEVAERLADTTTTRVMGAVDEGIKSAGSWLEDKTGGVVLKEDFQSLANIAMMGTPRVAGPLRKLLPKRAEPGSIEIPPAGEAAPKALPGDPARMPLDQLARHFQETIDKTETMTAKQRRARQAELREAFESGRTEAGETLDQLRFKSEESARQSARYEAEEAAREARENEARSYEAQPPETPDLTQSDLLRIMQKPPFERTAEDLVALRTARNRAMAVGAGATALAALADDSEDVAGAAAAVGMLGSSGGFRGPRKQIGAIKPSGGMWHPEAVERLKEPLISRLGGNLGREEVQYAIKNLPEDPKVAWADRAVQNWLNKYAGTTKDPLKDIEIPFGEGMKRWEEVTDAVIRGESVQGPKGPETQYNLQGLQRAAPGGPERSALTSYLSHVGDYLRQNVPPEKLSQYDLTRAVRETALNDARVAKQMEKAAAEQTQQLPTYAQYEDGFRWVELKLPEKLTPEQAKGVKLTKDVTNTNGRNIGEDLYTAVDAQGKPITNSYTGENAKGRTPEEAWLAGQLAREGNTMGHCVGGYCEGVASGESRIFSLRDPKGQSHVTVEVNPETPTRREGWIKADKEQNWREWSAENPLDNSEILQIKGKQNRAPDSKYLPYVQDFVKGGKWGEVGDLENTGLKQIGDKFLSQEETNGILQKFGVPSEEFGTFSSTVLNNLVKEQPGLLSELPATESLRRVLPGQRGAADPELLGKVAAIGGGAALLAFLDEENPETAAMLGGAFGYIGTKIPWSKGGKAADYALGNVSTRIGNISEPLKLKLRDFERRVLERSYTYKSLGDKFFIDLNKLPKAQQREVKLALLSGDPAEMQAAMERTGRPELAREWGKVASVMDSVGGELEALGRIKRITGYFPRIVNDLPGLLEALDSKTRTGLDKALADADRRAVRIRGEGLNEIERSQIVNSFLLEPMRQGGRPGWSRSRRVQEITEKLEPFYLDPTASFHAYVRRSALDMEKARLFGKDAQLVQDRGGTQHLNTQASIGNLVDRELRSGKIDQADAIELRDMLRSRFEGGERVSNSAVQAWRNLANLGLLGQVVAAVPQLGDAAMAGAVQGIKPALAAVGKVLTGKNELSMRDMGLVDHISEEFVTADKLANAVNSTFKWSGFSAVDAFGKNVNLNAARTRWEAAAKNAKGQAELAAKYGEAFAEDFPQLVKDLQAGKLTDLTKTLYFSELSNMQPISKLEMPQAYLDNPNGRLLYTFKSFMLKQLDLARNMGWNEIKKGNTREGLANLTRLGLTLGVAGATTDMIKDFILGKDFDPKWEDIPENMLRTYGMSEYIRDKFADGKVKEGVLGVVAPPMSMFDDLLQRDPRAIKYLPIIGQLLYAHSEEGEKAEEKRKQRDAAREIDKELKPFFGEPSERQKEAIRERKRELREDRQ